MAVIAAIFFGCGKEEPAPVPIPGPEPDPVVDDDPPPGDYFLPLIETTDIHGYILDNDNGAIHYRLAYIADKANDIRGHGDQCEKKRLLLLDGGDIYQGA